MASKGLKIIINGSASYVPNTEKQRRFWMDHNTVLNRPPKIRDVESHLATIIEATQEEVEQYLFPKPKARRTNAPVLPNLAEENKAMKGEIDQLKNMLLQLLANQGGSVPAQPVAVPVVAVSTPEPLPVETSEPEEDEELLDIFGPETERRRGRPKKS